MEQNKKIPCHYPWSSIYVSPNGDVRHCCSTNLNKLGNVKEQSVEEIWNGTLYKKVRKKIAEGDFDGAYCNSNCEGLRTGKGYPWVEPVIEASSKIKENEAKAIISFESGEEEVSHLPTFLQIEFSDNCNFRCVMCFYEFKPPYNIVPEDAVTQLQKMSTSARRVALMGGEVFMNKSDLKFIDNFEAPQGATMGFITNASYLDDKMIERIKKFKKIDMQISIDGTVKEVFEKIRRRGNWEVVNNNIHRVVSASNELREKGYDWAINLAYVVMASNISNLADAIKYAIDLGIRIDINPVKGFHLLDENIFVYKNALKKVGDWKTHLNNAFNMLEKHRSTYPHFESVLMGIKDIEAFINGPKINPPHQISDIIRWAMPDNDSVKAQGLSKQDSDVAQLFEVYFNWRTGKSSLKNTISYLGFKAYRRLNQK